MGQAVTAAATLALQAAQTTYSVVQGEQARKARSKSLRQQDAAQNRAKTAALGERRRQRDAFNRANRKTPSLADLLESAAGDGLLGLGRTTLAGGRPSPLTLGSGSSLGGVL